MSTDEYEYSDKLKAMFDRFDEEFLKFDRIESPAHRRPDICAFIMLDAAVEKRNGRGGFSDMVCSAEHDEIWLDVNCEQLAKVATDDMIRDLARCGVRYDDDTDSLAMFV